MLDFVIGIAVYPLLGMLAWSIHRLLWQRQNDEDRPYGGYPHDPGVPYCG